MSKPISSSKYKLETDDLLQELRDIEDIEDELEQPDLPSIKKSGISSTDWTVETIAFQMRKGNIDLNPNFQRRFAWVEKRRSQFIESLVLGFPVPPIVLAQNPQQAGMALT